MSSTAPLINMSQDEKKDDTILSPLSHARQSSTMQKPGTSERSDVYLPTRGADGDMGNAEAIEMQKTTIIRSKSRHFSNDIQSNQFHSYPISSLQPVLSTSTPSKSVNMKQKFGETIRKATNSSPEIQFDSTLRKAIEEFIAKGRRIREERRQELFQRMRSDHFNSTLPTASDIGVPYPSLRKERSFLYDEESYPLDKLLRDLLGVSDLSLIHEDEEQDKKRIMHPLLNRASRQAFHECYDNFVTSFCIPLLHSLAMMENIFNDNTSSNRSKNNLHGQSISYRYQAFPCIRIMRPGEFSIGPHCDMAYGHSIGNINFHIPLTPTYGTNALYTESRPGREDWHPLTTKSVGMGFVFDGARCLHYSLENTTCHTRVSIDFRVAISRKQVPIPRNNLTNTTNKMKKMFSEGNDEDMDQDCGFNSTLCSDLVLRDNFSLFPGYYDEAYLDSSSATVPGKPYSIPGSVVQKTSKRLMDPDKRVGFPF